MQERNVPELSNEDAQSLRSSTGAFLDKRTGQPGAEVPVGSELAQAWRELTDLGWLALAAPREAGGMGYGAAVHAILAEESATRLNALPLLPALALATPIAVSVGARSMLEDLVSGKLRVGVAWASPEGSGRFSDPANAASVTVGAGGRLRGVKAWVPHVRQLDALIVTAQDGGEESLWLVDLAGSGVEVIPCDQIDVSRPLSTVRLDAAGERLADGSDAVAALELARRHGSAWLCAEAVGIAQAMLRSAVDYAKQRRQFGRLIGEYQAVSHSLAELYVDLELSRSAAHWSAAALDAGEPDSEAAVQCGLAMALPTAVSAAEKALQAFGGIGMAWETHVHWYYKRALALGAFDGSAARARDRLGRLLPHLLAQEAGQ
jgi:alkylation response protein AidB-like acyl-CoA dehydrogenase